MDNQGKKDVRPDERIPEIPEISGLTNCKTRLGPPGSIANCHERTGANV
jgi:hypothetical protein